MAGTSPAMTEKKCRVGKSYCVTHFVVCVLKLWFRNMDIVAGF
jgi:hypothetical protein